MANSSNSPNSTVEFEDMNTINKSIDNQLFQFDCDYNNFNFLPPPPINFFASSSSQYGPPPPPPHPQPCESPYDFWSSNSSSHQENSLIYNQFDLGNQSFDSIPDSLNQNNLSMISVNSQHEFYPYTPTISDTSSLTPNSTYNDDLNHLSISKIKKKSSYCRLNKNLLLSTSSTPVENISPLSSRYKPLDLNNLSVNNNLSTSTDYSVNSNLSLGMNLPVSVSTPTTGGLPPINTFHHNSDTSSISSFISKNENKPKKYTRRRLLPRSKNGCWICRIKHLKCDENRPVCSTCSKFGIQCDYSTEKPFYVTDKVARKQKLNEISIIRKQNQNLLKRKKSSIN